MYFDISALPPVLKHSVDAQAASVTAHINKLRAVRTAGDYSDAASSINLPFDEAVIANIEQLAAQLVGQHLRHVFLVGIGGSNLGTKAIYDALLATRDILPHQSPRLWCLDSNQSEEMVAYQALISSCQTEEEFVIVAISKSGGTTETMANLEVLLAGASTRFPRLASRIVVISDAGSAFLAAAAARQMHTVAMPNMVGGRYSVMSAVGLLPLALLGISIAELTQGARDMVFVCLRHDVVDNPAAAGALVQKELFGSGYSVHNLFVFDKRLESLGKWWRQLLGESVGKQRLDGGAVGLMPTVAVGSTDLHSMGQLYLGGDTQTFTSFVVVQNGHDVRVPARRFFPELVPMIHNTSFQTITSAILSGTTAAYADRGRPFVTIGLVAVTPYELGVFMQYKMIETMYIGWLLGVDPFNQPDVEAYKIATKERLENHPKNTV